MINRIAIIVPLHRLNTDVGNILKWLDELPSDYQLIVVHDVKFRRLTINEVINFENIHPNLNIVEGYFGGPGSARNEGLSLVDSKQIAFWDSDDLPNIKNFNQVLDMFIESKFEIAACGYTKIDIKNQSIKINTPDASNDLFHIAMEVALWRFIFKASALKDLKFPDMVLGEDQVFICNVLKDFNKFTTYTDIVYNYRYNNNNQLTSTSDKPRLIKLIIDKLLIEIDSGDRNQQILVKLLVIRLFVSLLRIGSLFQVRILLAKISQLLIGDLISFRFNFLIYFKFSLYILSKKLRN